MHFNRANLSLGLAFSLLARTALAQQAVLVASNKCTETVYLVYTNSEFTNAQATLTSGQGFEIILSGAGIGYTRFDRKYLLILGSTP